MRERAVSAGGFAIILLIACAVILSLDQVWILSAVLRPAGQPSGVHWGLGAQRRMGVYR